MLTLQCWPSGRRDLDQQSLGLREPVAELEKERLPWWQGEFVA